MKTKVFLKLTCALLGVLIMFSVLTGCFVRNFAFGKHTSAEAHAPVTIQSPFRNLSDFLDLVHRKYPEINLEVIPYSGANMTAYMTSRLRAGDMPDIYFSTTYVPGRHDVSDRLIDLSAYRFTDGFAESQLRAVSDNGAVYMLPTYYTCLGITYNKTLLEKHGWELPRTFAELEELASRVREAGCRLAVCQIELPGSGFQYLCNILDTVFLNTLDGRVWQDDFLSGKTTVADSPEMLEALSVLEKWKSLGMLDGGDPKSDANTKRIMAEGNTLFMLGSSNNFTPAESEDEFGLMPYLSEDGTQNALIANISRYVGLNKHLEDAGNEQKLIDALHVMEVLTTAEGIQSINDSYSDTSLLPLRNYTIPETSYYKQVEDDLNRGLTAPFIYDGWENIIVPVGNAVISYMRGLTSLDSIAVSLDNNRSFLWDDTSIAYTTVTEKLTTDDCARFVGISFAQAVNADLALISVNKWYKMVDDGNLNTEGVSGELYPLPVTSQIVTGILPTGWRRNIQTVRLTGKRIRELAEKGYDRYGDESKTFPYVLVTPEGMSLSDTKSYTVVICGLTQAVAAEGKLTDTGIPGLEAALSYLSGFETLCPSDLVWR